MKTTKTIFALLLISLITISGTSFANAWWPSAESNRDCFGYAPSSVYNLISFTGVKGSLPGGGNTANFSWTATGETQITGYELRYPTGTAVIASFPSSNSDSQITRNHTITYGNFLYATQYSYCLKIYFADGTSTYSNTVTLSFSGKKIKTSNWQ